MASAVKFMSKSANEKLGEDFLDPISIGRGMSFEEPVALLADTFRPLWVASISDLTDWNHDYVYDPFWRVYYNAVAGNHLVCDGKKVGLRPGIFVIIPANTLFQTYAGTKPVPHFSLHFTLHPRVGLSGDKPIIQNATSLGQNLIRELGVRLVKKRTERSACLHLSLSLLHLIFAAILEDTPPSTLQREEIARVLQALEVDPLSFSSPDQMAQFAGMSSRSFQRHFQNAAGCCPSVYLKQVRLREAARQLIFSDLSVDAIAERLKFADRFHFSRLFRSFVGMPPATFRKNNRQRR